MDFHALAHIYQQWVKRLQKPLDALGQDFNTEYAANKNFVFNAAGLAIKAGGTSPDFLTANTLKYQIAGAYKTLAAVADTAISAATPTLVASQSCVFLVQVDAAGTLTTKAGTVVSGATGSVVPPPDAGKAAVGLLNVACGAGFVGTFTPGVGGTNLDAANVTTTYTDFVAVIIPPTLTAYPHQPTRQDAGGVTAATYDPSVAQNSGTYDEDNLPQLPS